MVCNQASGNATIIVSSVVSDDEVFPAKAAGGEEIPDVLNWIEEADDRLLVHVEWAVCVKQCKRAVVVSNDTDTFALLKEIWQQYGTGEKRCMLPLHQAVSNLGAPLAKTMIKAHILTGDDYMSKVGTKHAAMASDPVQYLTNFGEVDTLPDQQRSTCYVSGQRSGQIQLLKLLMTSGWKMTPVPGLELMLSLPQVV